MKRAGLLVALAVLAPVAVDGAGNAAGTSAQARKPEDLIPAFKAGTCPT